MRYFFILKQQAVSLTFIALALVGCTTVSPYHAKSGQRDTGYSDLQLENNRYHVSFIGDHRLSQQELEAYLLYRSAEITQEAGYDYFITRDSKINCDGSDGQAQIYSGYSYHYYPAFSDPIYRNRRCTTSSDILLFKGEKPTEQINAYQATDLIHYLNRDLFNKSESQAQKAP